MKIRLQSLSLSALLFFVPLIASADAMGAMAVVMVIFYGGILVVIFIISLVILLVFRSIKKRANKETKPIIYTFVYSFGITFTFAILGYTFFQIMESGHLSYLKCQIKPSISCAYQAARISGDEKFCLYVDEKVKGYGTHATTFNRADCYFAVAQKNGDISLCEFVEGTRISILPQRDYCVNSIALHEKNGAVCGEVNDLSMRNRCYDEIGWRTRNASLCDRIIEDKNMKDSCYKQIAMMESNSLLCEKIEQPAYKDECYKFAEK